jgi:hypothetical protein
MEKKLTPEEIAEQELADKMKPLFEERFALELNRGNGVTLEKSEYIGYRTREIEEELGRLKTPKPQNEQ